jgi:hypothetical protein
MAENCIMAEGHPLPERVGGCPVTRLQATFLLWVAKLLWAVMKGKTGRGQSQDTVRTRSVPSPSL